MSVKGQDTGTLQGSRRQLHRVAAGGLRCQRRGCLLTVGQQAGAVGPFVAPFGGRGIAFLLQQQARVRGPRSRVAAADEQDGCSEPGPHSAVDNTAWNGTATQMQNQQGLGQAGQPRFAHARMLSSTQQWRQLHAPGPSVISLRSITSRHAQRTCRRKMQGVKPGACSAGGRRQPGVASRLVCTAESAGRSSHHSVEVKCGNLCNAAS
jgi:hypothetical protein